MVANRKRVTVRWKPPCRGQQVLNKRTARNRTVPVEGIVSGVVVEISTLRVWHSSSEFKHCLAEPPCQASFSSRLVASHVHTSAGRKGETILVD